MKGTRTIRLGRASTSMILILACANSICYQSVKTFYGTALRSSTETSTSGMTGTHMIRLGRASSMSMLIWVRQFSLLAERLTSSLA